MNYICFETIGIGDRLGSQMFNFAAMYTVAQKTNHQLAIEKNKLNFGKFEGQQIMLDAFEYPFAVLDNTHNFKTVEIKEFAIYYPNIEQVSLYELNPNINYKIVGRLDFCQNIYIDNIKEIQNNLFIFKNKHTLIAQNFINELKTQNNKEIVSLHFRRTDYLACSPLNLTLNYYREALFHFNPKKHILLLFSDDVEFCETEVKAFLKKQNSQWDIYLSKNNPSNTDMCLMSLCDHNIIANSSYSFMAAILNKNPKKQIICPTNWFKTETHPAFKEWILISAT
jgi:hypothetical protein